MQPSSDLQKAYIDATKTNGLIELTRTIREPGGKYKIKKTTIYEIFKNTFLWDESKTKSGHVKFKNKITQTVIGYQNHGDSTMDPGGAQSILDNVQDHLNILCNEVFAYKTRNWRKEPNYKQAERNLSDWKTRQSSPNLS